MQQHILVAGYSTRHVVQSAWKAGYVTYAIDHFCDQDLFWYTQDRMRFEELDEIPGLIESMCEKYPIDYLVVTSGAELIRSRIPLLGTPPSRLAKFLNKKDTYRFFENLGISTPALAGEDQYPVMVKPIRGAGGWRNRILHTDEEKEDWLEEFSETPAIFQQIVEGTPASVSCLSDGNRALAVAVNEQFLRGTANAPYGFAGSITPIKHLQSEEMIHLAEKAAGESGCVGTIGVDFVLSDKAYAIEINPRFQATLDTIEMATGCNLFTFHAQAYAGKLPLSRPMTKRYAARRILFADRDMELGVDLSRFAPSVADIPWPGTPFEEGDAVISVFGHGATRETAEQVLDTNITGIRRYIER